MPSFVNRVPRAWMPTVIGSNGFTESILTQTPSATGWQTYTADSSIPANAVIEVQLRNMDTAAREMGVRAVGSSLSRIIDIGRTYDTGYNANIKMFVALNSSRQFQGYAEVASNADFLITGYWTGVTFTEKFVEIRVTSTEDDQWIASNSLATPVSGTAGSVATMLLGNDANGVYPCGARSVGSSLDRKFDLGNAYVGIKGLPATVKLDSNGNFELFIKQYASNVIYFLGEFDGLDFVEAIQTVAIPTVNSTWTDLDLSSYLDQDGRVVDVVGTTRVASGNDIGFRTKGSTASRMTNINTENGTNYWGWGCCTGTDANGTIQTYLTDATSGDSYMYMMGYYK